MSGHQSNLSSAKYGYDLVVATTQDSINATMKAFLLSLDEKDFNACYQWDSSDPPKAVPLDYQQVVNAIGGTDPFAIPDKADPDPKVKALDDLGFAFAFRASMGVSDSLPVGSIPDIITLDRGNSFVTYQLFCAKFEILVLDELHHKLFWTNISQPDASPWIFKFNVDLDLRTDNDYFGKLPVSVQNRVKNLNPDSAFSVQQLYLDLNTAGLQDEPAIEGLNTSSPAYEPLMQAFVDTYWKNAKKNGDPLLGYAVKPVTPNPREPSIIPTDLNIEVSPNLDAQGNETKVYGLYTLDYLVMSHNHALPAPVPFEWNWIDSTEEADYDGVAAIKRDIFVDFLKGLVNEDVALLCIDTKVDLTHSGDNYTITYSYKQSESPASFAEPTTLPAPADGFQSVLTLGYVHNSHDDSEAADHLSSIHGDFNYSLSGDVSFKNDVIRLTLHAVAYIQFNTHEMGISYSHLDGNYFDVTQTVTYNLGVTAEGELVAEKTDKTDDNSLEFSWKKGGILDLFGQMNSLKKALNEIKDKIGNGVKNAFKAYEDDLTNLINNSHAWVFPGGKTFSYKVVYFSDHQDLVTHVTYVDPT
jgi:hypothetical protein